MSQISLSSLATALKLSQEEIDKLVKKEDGSAREQSEIESLVASHVQKFISNRYTDGMKTGEGRGKVEGEKAIIKLLQEKFGIADIDDVNTLITTYADNLKAHTKIDPKDVRSSQEYKSLQEAETKKYNELKNQFDGFKQSIEIEKINGVVRQKLTPLFDAFDIPDNEFSKAQKDLIVQNYMQGKKFAIENDRPILLAEDGSIQKDPTGMPLDFELSARGVIGSFYPVKVGDQRKSPHGNGGGAVGRTPAFFENKAKNKIALPKDFDEMNDVADTIADDEERIEYLKASEAHLSKTE